MLVNSAGIGIGGRVEDLPAKHLDLQLGVNLRGLFLVTQAAIPLLRESRGWIVNLASIAGTLPTPGLATYGATKAAVIALTRSLNEELDADGVRAIALCPGFVDTPMAQWSGIEPAEMIQPEDCAEVVRMCLRLSPHARIPQVVIERMGSTRRRRPRRELAGRADDLPDRTGRPRRSRQGCAAVRFGVHPPDGQSAPSALETCAHDGVMPPLATWETQARVALVASQA